MIKCWWLVLLAVAAPAAASSPVLLVPGGTRSTELAPGDVHAYEATLDAGDFLHVRIEQDGVDVVVQVVDPVATPREDVDNPFGREVPESVALVAAVAGVHRLEVRPFRSVRTAGRYRLTVAAWRPVTDVDRLHVEAEVASQAAHRAADRRTADDLRTAASGYRRAAALWQRAGDGREASRMMRRLGQMERRLGDYAAAHLALDAALSLARGAEATGDTAATLNEMGIVHRRQGDHGGSVALFEQALTIWQAQGDTARAGRVHNNLAAALQTLGQPAAALGHYEQAITIAVASGDRLREATTLINLGHLRDQRGALDQAVNDLERARSLAVELDRPDLEAAALHHRGTTLDQLGELNEALASHGDALEIYRALGDARRQAAVLASQGALLIDLGEPASARQRLHEAAMLLDAHPDPLVERSVQLNLGVAARDLGALDAALTIFERLAPADGASNDPHGQALAWYHQAVTQQRRGHVVVAETLAQRALGGFRAVGNAQYEVATLRVLGACKARRGAVAAARATLRQAAERATIVGDRTEHARILQAWGRLERDVGALAIAAEHMDEALGILESLRSEIAGDTLRATHFATVRGTYELAIDIAMQRHARSPDGGFDERAFAYSERARARGLRDVLTRSRAGPNPGISPAVQDDRQRALRRQINTLALQRRRFGGATSIDAQIAALTAEYRLREGRGASGLAVSVPTVAEASAVPAPSAAGAANSAESLRGLPSTPHSLGEVASLLDADTVLLELALGESRSYLWVVDQNRAQSFVLPDRATLEAAAARVHHQVAQPMHDRGAHTDALEALSAMVLQPAFDRLHRRRWLIVADGALHYVPFAVLPVPAPVQEPPGREPPVHEGRAHQGSVPLIAHHEVAYLPSAAWLGRTRPARAPSAGARVAILADPVYGLDDPRFDEGSTPAAGIRSTANIGARRGTDDGMARLPWSGREAQAIATALGPGAPGGPGASRAINDDVMMAVGFEAHRGRVMDDDLGRYRVVHFATHGVLDTEHPALSGLVLSRFNADGQPRPAYLRLHDVYALRWHTELVVLSGCQTALGRVVRGEGLVGLAHGFLQAGASQVVASLWSVRDQATAALMEHFYRALFQDQQAPAAALHTAQRALADSRRWRDPYFWAGFVLVGDTDSGWAP